MKKHLSLPPPTLGSFGVQAPPAIEAVVRHALEKEVFARTPSVEAFLEELKAAVDRASSAVRITREMPVVDPYKTMATSGTSATSSAIVTNPAALETAFEKERIAREELETRRRADEEATRKRADEAERLRKEEEERELRERQHQEQLERVARQAEALEEKLARLSSSVIPEGVAAVDPRATHLQQRFVDTQGVGHNSFPDAQPGTWPQSDVSFPGVTVRPKSSASIALGVILIIILVAGGAVGYFMLRPKGVVVPNGTTNGSNPGNAPVTFKAEFVDIPGGTYRMGRDDGPPQERPAHSITVKPFSMSKTEVTNAEYAEFVSETNYAPPAHFRSGKPPFGQELWPVVNVSVDDAKAFAAWRSKRDGVKYRLPTEEEWEYAARGGDQDYVYPWGNRWLDGRAVVKEAFPRAVGSAAEGRTRWGILDMIGNVWEWTSTEITFYPGNTGAELSPQYKGWIVKRGGSYLSDPNDKQNPITATYRDFAPVSTKHPTIGFRLVRSAQGE
jgi:formylglycine-generating enzyme required for sulfatase activity